MNLVFKGFLTNINFTADFCTLFRRVSRFSIENFSSHSAKNFVEEPFCVAEKFWYHKILWIREGRGREGVSRFSVENLLSQYRKKFVEEPFCVAENFWYCEILWIRGEGWEGASQFYVKFFWSHTAEKFCRQPFRVPLIWSIKNLCIRGIYQDFLSKICCLTVQKNFVGEPLCFEKFPVSKNFIRGEGREGASHNFTSNFFGLTLPKNFVGNPLEFH